MLVLGVSAFVFGTASCSSTYSSGKFTLGWWLFGGWVGGWVAESWVWWLAPGCV